MHLSSKQDFLEKLHLYEGSSDNFQSQWIGHTVFESNYRNPNPFVLIDNETFIDKHFNDMNFTYLHFKKCHFKNCSIDNLTCSGTDFEECSFTDSSIVDLKFYEGELKNCELKKCMISYCQFSDSSLQDVKFISCKEILELKIRNSQCNQVYFNSSSLAFVQFSQLLKQGRSKNFNFKSSTLNNCSFSNLNLKKSTFENNTLRRNAFIDCQIGSSTFDSTNSCNNSAYSSIDFHSINKSEIINERVLKTIFGITEPDIKGFTEGLINEASFQSVFISYSFKDKAFVHIMNESLRSNGVITFLWEKDAPGGQRLKEIMSKNVLKHDRILFISSQNSIKSEACQYELTEGRKKQNTNWDIVFFPIHIDNYLFEVKKDDIKPNEKKEEYWNNITELKEINSLDFSKFNSVSFDKDKFNSMVSKLVSSLKKTTN